VFLLEFERFQNSGRANLRALQTEVAAFDGGIDIGSVEKLPGRFGIELDGPGFAGVLAPTTTDAAGKKLFFLQGARRTNQTLKTTVNISLI
jgi:hypothetical protein